jgi:hypothetical protein
LNFVSRRQLGDVGCDLPGLVVREHVRLPSLILVAAEVRVGDRLQPARPQNAMK